MMNILLIGKCSPYKTILISDLSTMYKDIVFFHDEYKDSDECMHVFNGKRIISSTNDTILLTDYSADFAHINFDYIILFKDEDPHYVSLHFKLSDMIKIYQSLSLEDLKTEIEALERQRDQAAGANEQRANELQQQLIEKQAALDQALLEKEYYKLKPNSNQ